MLPFDLKRVTAALVVSVLKHLFGHLHKQGKHSYSSSAQQSTCLLQEFYCFVLLFILKWVAAAFVMNVLVNLFSRLHTRGDPAAAPLDSLYACCRSSTALCCPSS